MAAAGCLAFAAPAAQALVASAPAVHDPQTTFTINGNTLTIQSSDPVLLEFVRGSELGFLCDSVRTPHVRKNPFVRWGEHATSVTFDISSPFANPGFCAAFWFSGGAHPLPRGGIEFAVAPFTGYWRRKLASWRPPGPLLARALLSGELGAIQGMQYVIPYEVPTSFPAPRTVVEQFDAIVRRRGLSLVYARDLRGVKLPGIPYLIGRGSTSKRLELAVIGLDGKLYVVRGGLNGPGRFGLG